jgi:hypothetical protein
MQERLSVSLPFARPNTVAVVAHRIRRSFNERDRRVLNLVQFHVSETAEPQMHFVPTSASIIEAIESLVDRCPSHGTLVVQSNIVLTSLRGPSPKRQIGRRHRPGRPHRPINSIRIRAMRDWNSGVSMAEIPQRLDGGVLKSSRWSRSQSLRTLLSVSCCHPKEQR